jgi:DNA-binding transcriptional ArsR family regulator
MLQAVSTDALFDALGDGTRRAILEQLRGGPLPVVEITRRLPVGRPAVSQHLKVLKAVGLVTAQQDGTRRRYRIEPAGITAVRAWLDGLWEEALDSYKAAVERDSAS